VLNSKHSKATAGREVEFLSELSGEALEASVRRSQKSVKQGSCDVEIQKCDVNYSKNGMKCTMKFNVAQTRGFYGEYYSDDDDY